MAKNNYPTYFKNILISMVLMGVYSMIFLWNNSNAVVGTPEIRQGSIDNEVYYNKVFTLFNGNTIQIECDQLGFLSAEEYSKYDKNGVFIEAGRYKNGAFVPDYTQKYILSDIILITCIFLFFLAILIYFIRFEAFQAYQDKQKKPFVNFDALSKLAQQKIIAAVECPCCSQKGKHEFKSEFKNPKWDMSMLIFDCFNCQKEFKVRR